MKSSQTPVTRIRDLLEAVPDTDHDDPESAVAKEERVPFLRRVMRRILTALEQFVVEDYFGIGRQRQTGLTMAEIGKSRRMSRRKVGRIIRRALEKLRKALGAPEYADAV